MFKIIRLFVIIGVLSFSCVEGAGVEGKESGAPVAVEGTKDAGKQVARHEGRVDDGGPSSIELVGRIVIYLLLLAAIGAVILHFFKQGKFMKGMRSKGNLLKVTETHVLGNKQFLVVVEYGEKKVLLGVGPGMINKLCFLDGAMKEESAEIK